MGEAATLERETVRRPRKGEPTRPAPTPEDQINQMKLTAVHEVSHVVVSVTAGMPMRSLEIRRHFFGGTSGCAKFDWTKVDARGCEEGHRAPMITQQEFRAILFSYLAGARGVARWLVQVHHWDVRAAVTRGREGSSHDYREFRRLSGYAHLTLAGGTVEADRIIRGNWSRIVRGAGALEAVQKMKASKV